MQGFGGSNAPLKKHLVGILEFFVLDCKRNNYTLDYSKYSEKLWTFAWTCFMHI